MCKCQYIIVQKWKIKMYNSRNYLKLLNSKEEYEDAMAIYNSRNYLKLLNCIAEDYPGMQSTIVEII